MLMSRIGEPREYPRHSVAFDLLQRQMPVLQTFDGKPAVAQPAFTINQVLSHQTLATCLSYTLKLDYSSDCDLIQHFLGSIGLQRHARLKQSAAYLRHSPSSQRPLSSVVAIRPTCCRRGCRYNEIGVFIPSFLLGTWFNRLSSITTSAGMMKKGMLEC